jgi:hypothetical protein
LVAEFGGYLKRSSSSALVITVFLTRMAVWLGGLLRDH